MTKNTLWTVFVFILLCSCKDKLDKNFQIVKDRYKVGYFDNPDENLLVIHSESIGAMGVVINPKIKRLGSNDRFIIAERVGDKDVLDKGTVDSTKLSYYIVDMTRKNDPDDKEFIFETVDYKEFEKRKEELGISQLTFTKEFKIQ
jgi:hypothetical protein